jgi:hypothetical protein
MFHKENSKNYINQPIMVDSKSEMQNQKKKVQLPATFFNRSPIRDRVSIIIS